MAKEATELFTRDESGNKTDAPIHDAILDNPQADEVFNRAVERLKKELHIIDPRKP